MGKKIFGILGVLIFIGIKIALKVGVGTGVTEAEVKASKYMDWPTDFKQAMIQGCVSEFKENKIQGQAYCDCYATGLEKAQVVETKYNSLTTSEQQYTQQLIGTIQQFLASEQGKKLIKSCGTVAENATKKPVETTEKRNPSNQ